MFFANTWNNIVAWFNDRSERNRLVRSFNQSAKDAFVMGRAPTMLKASISRGGVGVSAPVFDVVEYRIPDSSPFGKGLEQGRDGGDRAGYSA